MGGKKSRQSPLYELLRSNEDLHILVREIPHISHVKGGQYKFIKVTSLKGCLDSNVNVYKIFYNSQGFMF